MDYLLNPNFTEFPDNLIVDVLNLIINGLPSKHNLTVTNLFYCLSFKPYYKWITF